MFHLLLAAANPGDTVGKNLLNMLQGFAVPAWLGITGIIALGCLATRQVSKLAIFAVVALGVGVMVVNPHSIQTLVESVSNALTRGA